MLLTNNKGIFRTVPSNLAQSFLKEGWVEVVEKNGKNPVVEVVSAEENETPKPRAKRGTTK